MRRLGLLLLVLMIASCVAKPDVSKHSPGCGMKYKCTKMGRVFGVVSRCESNTHYCNGESYEGKKFCKGRKCHCCVSKDCSKDSLWPCSSLGGTCISQNEFCDGYSVVNEIFCMSSDSCKCCFPKIPPGKTTSAVPTCPPVVTYPDVTSPVVTCPSVTCPDVTSPVVTSPSVTYPDVTSPEVTSTAGCPSGNGFFSFKGDQCFKIFTATKISWYASKTLCENNDLRLAEPMDSTATELRQYLLNTYGNRAQVHLGAQGDGSYIRMLSDRQVIPTYSPLWYPGYPGSRTSSSYCLVMTVNQYSTDTYPGKPYYVHSCGSSLYPLCQMPLE